MPAMLEDPAAIVLDRRPAAGQSFGAQNMAIPPEIVTRQVTLRDRMTVASLVPLASPSAIPRNLHQYLCDQLNLEIEKGDTYPMISPLSIDEFGNYWFQSFGAVMLLGRYEDAAQVRSMDRSGAKWEQLCLGSFYIKPNYPGRSSHVCNGGFLVTEAARNRGVGRLMGEGYLEWAPKLGYSYSVFNLVYETNVASCRIWDGLGFKRIGRVKKCGKLRSYPHELVDAIIYGRDLAQEDDEYLMEERFDKIRFYLKHGTYPNGADRAEKSRLRSAATHYKLMPAEPSGEGETGEERLMLKGKEVVSDPRRQNDIARELHLLQHGGINKTTALIAEKYHWVRIKETVNLVIKNCPECKDIPARAFPTRSEPRNTQDSVMMESPSEVMPAAHVMHANSAAETALNALANVCSQNDFDQLKAELHAPNTSQMQPPGQDGALYSLPLDPRITGINRPNSHMFPDTMAPVAESDFHQLASDSPNIGESWTRLTDDFAVDLIKD